jgi:hypothetical protein
MTIRKRGRWGRFSQQLREYKARDIRSFSRIFSELIAACYAGLPQLVGGTSWG